MICRFSKNCAYYATYRYKTDQNQHELLVDSYCKGSLSTKCRRIVYEIDFGIEPPDDLAPNGYVVGTQIKHKVASTRRFERYPVTEGACLLQVLGTQKTFSAWINDISKGGMQLESSISLEDVGLGRDNYLKVIGHSAETLPFPLVSEVVKTVWLGRQVVGCSFVDHSYI